MPFTPIHMGPGIAVKAVMQDRFSLMVFGWTQIVMDIQPLFVLLTGEGHLHGFSHTYFGATLISIFACVTGKYLSEVGLRLMRVSPHGGSQISWRVSIISSSIGSYSHVLLDSIMHPDVEPFFPLTTVNDLQGVISVGALHTLCLLSGLVGAAIYYFILWRRRK